MSNESHRIVMRGRLVALGFIDNDHRVSARFVPAGDADSLEGTLTLGVDDAQAIAPRLLRQVVVTVESVAGARERDMLAEIGAADVADADTWRAWAGRLVPLDDEPDGDDPRLRAAIEARLARLDRALACVDRLEAAARGNGAAVDTGELIGAALDMVGRLVGLGDEVKP